MAPPLLYGGAIHSLSGQGERPVRYTFRPVSADDLPMLRRWLQTPEARRWWGDPGRQYALLEEDLPNPLMRMRIVSLDGRPFAYVQDYDLASWPQDHLAHFPPGTRGVDTFTGEPEMVGQGHGRAFLRLVAEGLIAEGAPCVMVDPDPDNARARRAYAGAGFVEDRTVDTPEGPAVLMIFRGPAAAS
jgi:aminoglycoside 6'-N-acetyltransferase